MTDTRKEFEELLHPICHTHDDVTSYYHVWFFYQACQQLNDKRIADLLAVIAKKDEALQVIVKETHHDLWQGELAKQAFSIQPSDVELVELPMLFKGEPAYAIQSKSKQP